MQHGGQRPSPRLSRQHLRRRARALTHRRPRPDIARDALRYEAGRHSCGPERRHTRDDMVPGDRGLGGLAQADDEGRADARWRAEWGTPPPYLGTQAGLTRESITCSMSTWCYCVPEERDFWGGTMADRREDGWFAVLHGEILCRV
ncbi:hypothetical protein OBBRIDRAFT_799183 [Obba rivulosa]|uniref:Uncharacterized protein n=1 Tax=Obba rivulosa TaxID=1052685 RepID=A0A8E2ASC9_9APHY|nr:hypothetical protein OBBRIDRAFT_799183 [Obba rivulosa]